MASRRRGLFGVVKDTIKSFSEDDCPTMAAALSYYTVFSLPPLLVLLLTILGAVLDPQDIQGTIEAQIRQLADRGIDESFIVMMSAQSLTDVRRILGDRR